MSSASAADPTPVELQPGNEVALAPAVDETIRLRLAVAAGHSVRLVLVQDEAPVRLTVSGTGTGVWAPFYSQSGRFGTVGLTLNAATSSQSEWTLALTSARAGSPASTHIRAGTEQVTTPADLARAAGEAAFRDAELARRALAKGTAPAADDAITGAFMTALDRFTSAGDDCGMLLARTGLARAYFELGQYIKARDAARAALAHRCGADDDSTQLAESAAAWRTLGSSLGYLGDLEAATAAHREALARYRATGDHRFQGIVAGNLAVVERELGATAHALETAGFALELAERVDDQPGIVFSREALASILLARGELGPALTAYRATLEALSETPYPMVEAQVHNDIGIIYSRIGDLVNTRAALAASRRVWEALGQRYGLAESWVTEGEADLTAGMPGQAAVAFRAALAVGEADALRSIQAHARLGLGRAALLAGDAGTAQSELVAARTLANEGGDVDVYAYSELALGDNAGGSDPEAAGQAYRRALKSFQTSRDVSGEILARASLARILRVTGQLEQARAELEQALERVEEQRMGIVQPGLRTLYFSNRRDLYDLYIDLLLELEGRADAPEAGYGQAAFAAVERARAAELRDQFAERRIDLRAVVPAELLAAEAAAEDEVRVAAWAHEHTPGESTLARLDRARRALDEIRGRLRAAVPRYVELVRPEPIGLDAAHGLLDPNSALLVIWLGPTRGALWLITTNGTEMHLLPARHQVEALAANLRDALLARAPPVAKLDFAGRAAQAGRRESAVTHAAQELGALLIAPLADRLPDGTLAIVADGALQLVPFGLLETGRGRLLDQQALVELPSVAALRGLREFAPPISGDNIAVVADPVYTRDDERFGHAGSAVDPVGGTRASSPKRGGFERLRFAAREAEWILHAAGADRGELFGGFAATRMQMLESDWSQTAVLHFAAHARLDMSRPELAAIALSGYDRAGRGIDGMLRVADIYRLHLASDLVVLSACDTAAGPAPGAEGVFSLARAFQHAGARRVLASLWPTKDHASAEFMRHFYQFLLVQRVGAAEALQRTQQMMAGNPRWREPVYWAGFVLQGDWR